jgi:hypothetical protein
VVGSLPFCTGYAINASLYAKPKVAAYIGLAVAVAELLTLFVLIVGTILNSV